MINDEEKLKQKIARLDWIKILDNAIKIRPTSWGTDIVREWRNASDTIWSAFMEECYKKKIFKKQIFIPFKKHGKR